MYNENANIDMSECIHCGVCHDVCPEDAVRHDTEKIAENVSANVDMTEKFMEACATYLGSEDEKNKCLTRMIGHFEKERIVAEKTLEQLRRLKNKFSEDG